MIFVNRKGDYVMNTLRGLCYEHPEGIVMNTLRGLCYEHPEGIML